MTSDIRPAAFGETDMLQAQLQIATLVRTATARYPEVMENVFKAANRDAAVAAVRDMLDCDTRSAKYVLDLHWLDLTTDRREHLDQRIAGLEQKIRDLG